MSVLAQMCGPNIDGLIKFGLGVAVVGGIAIGGICWALAKFVNRPDTSHSGFEVKLSVGETPTPLKEREHDHG